MRKLAKDLVPGDVVASGEVVLSAQRASYLTTQRKAKMLVVLKHPNKQFNRVAEWGYLSNIHMKGPPNGIPRS